MTLPPPQPAQLIARLREHFRADRPQVFAVRCSPQWPAGTGLALAPGVSVPVVACVSALQVREVLCGFRDRSLVILTDLDEHELGADVLARLGRRRLLRLDRWDTVRRLFGAVGLDPRLPAHGWLADALIHYAPEAGYPPVSTGLLEAGSAWSQLLWQALELNGPADPAGVLLWSRHPARLLRLDALDAEWRRGLLAWLADSLGPLGPWWSAALDAGHGALLLPIGLVAGVLFAPGAPSTLALAQAAARLEPWLGGRPLPAGPGRSWAALAAEVFARLAPAQAEAVAAQAGQLLEALRVGEAAIVSDVLAEGYRLRLQAFAEALAVALGDARAVAALETAGEYLRRHRLALKQAERIERLDSAVRLVRALHLLPVAPAANGLDAVVRNEIEHGLWLDIARRRLSGGDELPALAQVLARLLAAVRERREAAARVFAEAVCDWLRSPRPLPALLPVEDLLDQVLAPLAAQRPVLLLVLDGMDGAVRAQLQVDLETGGWNAITRPGQPMALLATVPSVTDCSRASLLGGRLQRGPAALEKEQFCRHPALMLASRGGERPELFHKAGLYAEDGTNLAPALLDAIASPRRRVVAAVLNAVDDFLDGADQLRQPWRVDSIALLPALLQAARSAGRIVVLTSDHGHLLDAGTEAIGNPGDDGGVRWRVAAGVDTPHPGECRVDGERLRALGLSGLLLPWSERLRYRGAHHGYHGGLNPQEMLVPLLLLIGSGEPLPDGFRMCGLRPPAWWLPAPPPVAAPLPAVEAAAPVAASRRRAPMDAGQSDLFADAGVSAAVVAVDPVARLLASPRLQSQRALAGRMAPEAAALEITLRLLEAGQGQVSRQQLGARLGLPEFRLRGVVAGLQRLLNVEGYPILTEDLGTGLLRLDRALLIRQFELDH